MASTYGDARDLLSSFITTEWATAAGTAPLLYDNLGGERPEDPTLFGRLTIQNVSSSLSALGGGRFRRIGLLTVQIFVPLYSGTEEADQVGESLVEALESVGPTTLENVWLRDIGMTDIGPDDAYHQVSINAEFLFDRVT